MNDNPLIRQRLTVALAVWLAAGGPALAQDADLERCSELESDAERLACFDAAIRQRSEAPPPPSSTPEVPAAPEAAAPAEATGSAAVAPAADPAAAAPAAAPAAAAAQPGSDYRLMSKEEKRAARRAKKEQEKARREYTAVVTGIRTRPHGQVAVTLDNGEVWSEQYASRAFMVSVGDTITLKKSRFSTGYRLVDEKGKGYAVTRLE